MDRNIWLDGMMGLIVGDALGIPVQFMNRDEIVNRPQGPVIGMESGGAFGMPAGTWSDDSSMALATLTSIHSCNEIDLDDIMKRFVQWDTEGEYTPFGQAFDQGITCTEAIWNYIHGRSVSECGKTGEYANGNGALMRILPVCLYCIDRNLSAQQSIELIHSIGSLTHNHLRSNICCGMYYFMAKAIIHNTNKSLNDCIKSGLEEGFSYYEQDIKNHVELSHLGRIKNVEEFAKLRIYDIKSSGYVIDSIEAAIYCILNTSSLRECLIIAVNLGLDTDTVAAIAGGLAGLYYGYDAIGEDWLGVIQRRDWLEAIILSVNDYNLEKVSDIHFHGIPGVDDGATDMDMSMDMISESYNQGVRNIVCTSHDSAYNGDFDGVYEQFRTLQEECARLYPDLKLQLGCEIYCEPETIDSIIKDINEGIIPTMCKTKYVLVEFSKHNNSLKNVTKCITRLLDNGNIPIIAHVEQYHRFLKVEEFIQLRSMGALLQMNAYSVIEEKKPATRELANALLERELIDFIGSDAHRTIHRPPRVEMGVRMIYNLCSREYADRICFLNAQEYFRL